MIAVAELKMTDIEQLLERNIGIEKYFSYVVIKSPFVKTHYPMETLFSHNDR